MQRRGKGSEHLFTSLAGQAQNYSPPSATAAPPHMRPAHLLSCSQGEAGFGKRLCSLMSHMWPFKSDRASSQPALSPPPITACPRRAAVPTEPSPGLERQWQLSVECSWEAPGTAQACGTQELPALLRITSTHASPCSLVRHSQAGMKHLSGAAHGPAHLGAGWLSSG